MDKNYKLAIVRIREEKLREEKNKKDLNQPSLISPDVALYIRTSAKSTYYRSSKLRQEESIKRVIYPSGLTTHVNLTVYSESCKDNTPIYQRKALSSLLEDLKRSKIKSIFVESFDRFSRSFDILSFIKTQGIIYNTNIISINSNKDIRDYSDKELEMYSNFLLEEKKLLITKLTSLKEVNKKKELYIPGRKNIYFTNFENPTFRELWEKEGLVSLSLRKIQKILYENNYKTATGKPLALNTISSIKKYYILLITK